MKRSSIVAACLSALSFFAGASYAEHFSFDDKPNQYLDVKLDGKIVARYMDAFDKSTPEKVNETYKPYLHIFDADGNAPITKGVGGQFPHHRGIFIGFNKIASNGKSYDRWHMTKGEIVHKSFANQKASDDMATFTSVTSWSGEPGGEALLEEHRTMTFTKPAGAWRLAVEFTSELKANSQAVELNGDPEHSGVQYRPAAELDTKETLYLYPVAKAEPHKDTDYPWVGETYLLNGKKYSVVELNHTSNPKGTRISAYRDYGRMGFFPTLKIEAGKSATLKYKFLIADGELPSAADIQKNYDQFVGASTPSAVPPTQSLPAEKSGTPKPQPAKPPAKTAAPATPVK